MRVATWTEGCLARLARTVCRYLPVDGGGGARLLAQLPTLSPYVRRVSSPRHAEILLVCEPISRLLVPAIVALYRAMPRPCGVLVVGDPGPEHYPGTDLVRLEDVLPGVVRVAATLRSLTELAQRMRTLPLQADAVPLGLHDDAQTVSLLEKQERDIATELVVLSLGPLQPLTAGPLRLLLLCHGEQVTSAQIEAGYAVRNLTRAMLRASWAARAALASALDPLAPVAGRLAYVPALEQLQGWEPDPSVQHQRDAALALERAQNALAWLARFVALLDAARLVATAQQLHERLTEISEGFWEQAPDAWIAPQGSAPLMQWNGQGASLARLATALEALRGRLARDRPLALRMTGLGVLTVERLRAAGADGPTYRARERGHDDVLGRLLTRLDEAAADLHHAAARVVPYRPATERPALWSAPRGTPDVAIAGPRGHIGLSITSDGETLCQVVWRRPSAVLLGLLPELRAGHKLADAEVIIASLDLAMAEADGSPVSSNGTDMCNVL